MATALVKNAIRSYWLGIAKPDEGDRETGTQDDRAL